MRAIPKERKVNCINGLCNGMSLRAVSRVFNTDRGAITRLLVRVGARCDEIMAEHMHDIDSKRLELDELWTFCGKALVAGVTDRLWKVDDLVGDC
ncbi:MAG: hypothetical protein IH936_05760 [Acidobacteria bacterium]|nr:hypothetical protein [Acidobacteriota bacterium]